MIPSLSAAAIRYIIILAGIVLLGLAVILGLNQCQGRKHAEKKAEVSQGEAGASIASGAEAVNTAAAVIASDDATDAQVAAAQAEIAAAARGQKGTAAKRAACRFRAYANSPQCREPKP